MANLQIKGIQDDLYEKIKEMAASENRSIGQQVLYLIKEYLASKSTSRSRKSPAQILMELSGSWEDNRDTEGILSDIKRGRKNSAKLREGIHKCAYLSSLPSSFTAHQDISSFSLCLPII